MVEVVPSGFKNGTTVRRDFFHASFACFDVLAKIDRPRLITLSPRLHHPS
jgi:hypothetical protein